MTDVAKFEVFLLKTISIYKRLTSICVDRHNTQYARVNKWVLQSSTGHHATRI